jgi:hypothetical protein
MVTARRTWLLLGLGALGSQAGHLLAYQVRFGAAAQQVQSTGAHAYFPALAKTGLGIAGLAVLAALFVIGLARVIGRRTPVRADSAPSPLSLIAALYAIQLTCFVTQELAEAAIGGMPASSAADLLLWGAMGQLPIAVVAAIAMRWLLVRFEAAVEGMRFAIAEFRVAPRLILPAAVAISCGTSRAWLLSRVAGASLIKRGPPSSVRFSLT